MTADDSIIQSSDKAALPQSGASEQTSPPASVAVATDQTDDVIRETTVTTTVTKERDKRGRYLPKPHIEFTWRHFWLEIAEVTIAILIAQALWEIGVWLIKNRAFMWWVH